MRLALQIISSLAGLLLGLAVIARMVRGPFRQYPFLFVYLLADFLTGVVETRVTLAYYSGNKSIEQNYVTFYWLDEVIVQVLVYAAVISLLYYATQGFPSRQVMRLSVISFAIVFAATSFAVHYNPSANKGSWMTPWSSNLNFCSAILDLALWAILIGSRKKDHRLLMISGALGIQFTGQAIGQSLRNLSQGNRSGFLLYTGDTIGILMYLAFLYILWQAFRPATPRNP